MQFAVIGAENQEKCSQFSTGSLGLGLLEHSSHIVRIHALSLLINSKSQREPLSEEIIRKLEECLPGFHSEVDPKTRNEFIALAKKLMTRVTAAIVAQRQAIGSYRTRSQEKDDIGHCVLENGTALTVEPNMIRKAGSLGHHFSFFRWYTSFLMEELQPTATYQRHITALEIVKYVLLKAAAVSSPSPPCLLALSGDEERPEKPSYTRVLVRPLLDLIMDPFDDVRNSAASIVFTITESSWEKDLEVLSDGDLNSSSAPKSLSLGETCKLDLSTSLYRAEALMRATGRADHADGFARTCQLVWQLCIRDQDWAGGNAITIEHLLSSLKADVKIARSDMRSAARTAPLHGHLIALRCD